MNEPHVVLDDLCFPEGPRWHGGRLYASDMHAHEVIAVDAHGRRETIARVPGRPSGLGFMPDGELRIVSMTDRKLLALRGGELVTVADLSALAAGHCNDMVIDAQGRAYVGNFGFDFDGGERPRTTRLLRVDPDGSASVAAEDLLFPNGCAITDDGGTLIVAETFAARLTAFRVAPDGTLHDRRVWAQLTVAADGICLDAEGCVWVANPVPPGCFLRVAEGGEIKQRIDLPDRAAIACMLGGDRRRTLFLLEAYSVAPERCTPGNGRVRKVEVDVPGAGWPDAR
jgi:sugar lactone lactonase YvrE